jgi:ATP-binding cassette subfamily B protein
MSKPMKKAKKGTFSRLLKMIFKFYPGAWIIVLICLLLVVGSNAAASLFLQQTTTIVEHGLASGFDAIKKDLLILLGVMITVRLASVVASLIQNLLMATITQGTLKKIRCMMFKKMEKLPIKYFDQHNNGDIMSFYTNDVDSLRQLISQSLMQIIQAVLMLICLIGIMLTFSIWLSLVVITGVVVMFFVTKTIGIHSSKGFIAQQKNIAKVEGYAEEMMNGQKVVKVFCYEDQAKKNFDALNEDLFQAQNYAEANAGKMGPVTMNIGNIMYVVLAFVGGLIITLSLNNPNIMNLTITGAKPITITYFLPILISFLTLSRQFTNNINQVAQQYNSIVMALAATDRIFTLIDEEEEKDEGYVTLVNAKYDENNQLVECAERTNIWAWKHPHEDGSVSYTLLQGDIKMFDVDFGYDPSKIVLHNVTLYAEPGQKVAFVGATGAGKTTITNLINRFYDIADGKIRYDGININKIKKSDLRRSLGIVLQDTNLFTGTIMDNIRYGKLDATDEECIAAAKLADADDFISRLPDGYNTMLTSDGANLSQGQRQLISIARAAVCNAPVMIMDEATSSIDTRTELLVQRGTDKLMEGRTVFVIAHRLSTVQNSDVIMVLDHGVIIERGNHESLIAKKGKYYQLYTGVFELE